MAKKIFRLAVTVLILGVFFGGICFLVKSEHFSVNFTRTCYSQGGGLYVCEASGFSFEINYAQIVRDSSAADKKLEELK